MIFYFSYFSQKTGFDISFKLSPNVKGKKEKYFSMSSAENLPRLGGIESLSYVYSSLRHFFVNLKLYVHISGQCVQCFFLLNH